MSDWQTERQQIEHECTRLITRFFNTNDSGDYRALADCFTEDGVFARPTDPANPIKGRETIFERFQHKPKEMLTVHILSNVEITAETRESARGFSVLMLYTATRTEGAKLPIPAAPNMVIGSFKSRFVRTPSGWRMSEHLGSLSLMVGSK